MLEKALLTVEQLQVNYGDVEAVRGASFQVNPGEVVTLLGSNGAGKSTTFKAICRLADTRSGDIKFDGSSLLQKKTEELVKLGIALVPEGRRVFPALTVTQNLELGAYGRPKEYIREKIKEMFHLFPSLERYAKKLASGLSGGEQQMLAIARALMSSPKLLLLDEPSLGLAPKLVNQVFEKLKEVNRQGTTILLIEQNVLLALKIAHRAYVMESGKVTISGSSTELMANHHVRDAYLGVKRA